MTYHRSIEEVKLIKGTFAIQSTVATPDFATSTFDLDYVPKQYEEILLGLEYYRGPLVPIKMKIRALQPNFLPVLVDAFEFSRTLCSQVAVKLPDPGNLEKFPAPGVGSKAPAASTRP